MKFASVTQQHGRSTVALEVAVRGEGFDRAKLILPVNPSEVIIERPSRQSVTQTLTGMFQDHLGAGVITVRIAGMTGWRGRNGNIDGYDAIKKLRDLLRTYDELASQGDPSRVEMRCLLNLPDGWEHFVVSKDTWTCSRSNREPLLWRYSINFIVIRDEFYPNIADPSPNFVVALPTPLPTTTLPDTTITRLPDTSTGDDGDGDGDGPPRVGGETDTDVDYFDESERDRRRREAMVGVHNPYFDDTLGYDTYTYYTFDIEAGNVPGTVGELANLLYPTSTSEFSGEGVNRVSLYPPNMYPYILAANRNYFITRLTKDAPLPKYSIKTQADIDSGRDLNFITLRIPRVAAGTANPQQVSANLGVPWKSGGQIILDSIGQSVASSHQQKTDMWAKQLEGVEQFGVDTWNAIGNWWSNTGVGRTTNFFVDYLTKPGPV